jgi:hypothetical protein
MMLDLDMTSILLLLGAVATGAVIYYVLKVAREWVKRNRPMGSTIARAAVSDSSLDAHIATQWTDGRLRLDFLLALIKKLGTALEEEVEALRRLDHADPQYDHEARQMVEPNLRRFTFDQHLRDECRVLITLLQFCARDIAQSQHLDMTQELTALTEIQAAIKLADRG